MHALIGAGFPGDCGAIAPDALACRVARARPASVPPVGRGSARGIVGLLPIGPCSPPTPAIPTVPPTPTHPATDDHGLMRPAYPRRGPAVKQISNTGGGGSADRT